VQAALAKHGHADRITRLLVLEDLLEVIPGDVSVALGNS
jgi:hypothetical protein